MKHLHQLDPIQVSPGCLSWQLDREFYSIPTIRMTPSICFQYVRRRRKAWKHLAVVIIIIVVSNVAL